MCICKTEKKKERKGEKELLKKCQKKNKSIGNYI